jgi:collagen type I/II/III/V/XI/XXIV/XXVII alpha
MSAVNVARYVRWTMAGSSSDASSEFVELQAWNMWGQNVALGAPATVPNGGVVYTDTLGDVQSTVAAGGTATMLTDGVTTATPFLSAVTAGYAVNIWANNTSTAYVSSSPSTWGTPAATGVISPTPLPSNTLLAPYVYGTVDSYGAYSYFATQALGVFFVATAGTAFFKVTSDDGSLLLIDGVPVCGSWASQPSTSSYGSVALSAGMHAIEVRYMQIGAGSSLSVEWLAPAASGSTTTGGYAMTFWTGSQALTGNVDYTTWGTPAAGVLLSPTLTPSTTAVTSLLNTTLDFTMRATATFNVTTAGTYQFTLTHDDGGALYIDGTLVIDIFYYTGTTATGSATLAVGNHAVDARLIQNAGGFALAISVLEPGGSTVSLDTLVTSLEDAGSTVIDADVMAPTTPASVVVYLGAQPQTLQSIMLWPYYGDGRVYHNVAIDTSLDGVTWRNAFSAASMPTAAITSSTGWVLAPWCFAEGTRIATPRGEMPIETLREGDEVLTADGTTVRVVQTRSYAWDVRGGERLRPVRIPKGTLGASRDLLLTDTHGVMVQGALLPSAHVPGAERMALQDLASTTVRYFHLRLPSPTDMLLAEGVPCEGWRG